MSTVRESQRRVIVDGEMEMWRIRSVGDHMERYHTRKHILDRWGQTWSLEEFHDQFFPPATWVGVSVAIEVDPDGLDVNEVSFVVSGWVPFTPKEQEVFGYSTPSRIRTFIQNEQKRREERVREQARAHLAHLLEQFPDLAEEVDKNP